MKNVVITGASGGIGAACARAFARAGYGVALHYHTGEDRARRVMEEINFHGGDAEIFPADLSREEEVSALFDRAEKRFGFLDTLVNNAGVSWRGLLTDMTPAEWNRLLAVDLTGVFLCCRRALPAMIREKRGSIVNVSSMWGEVGASCEAAYSAAKAGVLGLTKALAKEEGPSGVRVNAVTPGVIDTPMNGALTGEDLAALREETPLGRTGTPEDVARAVLFLAEHPFLTGQILGVSGGFVI